MADEKVRPLHTEYPVVVSKIDPLIVRVSATVLLVGSTSYTAKVKMGQMFNGFHVYVSSVGAPIYKEAVDISPYNVTADNNHGEGSDAWNHIESCACSWMDDLEDSMEKSTTQKNVVDLLREIKFQQHFDMSGHIIDPNWEQDYPGMEFCPETPVYMNDIINHLTTLTDTLSNVINKIDLWQQATEEKLSNINTSIGKVETAVAKLDTTNTRLDAIETQLNTMNNTTLPNNAQTISNAITTGLQTLVSRMNAMNTAIGNVKTDTNNILTSNTNGLPSVKTVVNNRTSEIQNTSSALLYKVNSTATTINSTVNTIHTTDKNAILDAISSGSGSSAAGIEEVLDAIDTLSGTVTSTSDNVGTCLEVIYTDTNSLYNIICNQHSDSPAAFIYDSDKERWFVNTELTLQELIDDRYPDDPRVKATIA